MLFLARTMVKYNASDLHLKVGRPPLFRVNGDLIPAKMPKLKESEIQEIIFSVMSEGQIAEIASKKDVDFSFRLADIGRLRCHLSYQRGTLTSALRMIPTHVPSLDDLGVPTVLKELCSRQSGMILITGAAGNGKSHTLAGMIRHINETRQVHVLSIEDPIEFLHTDMKSSVTQREVGTDTPSFSEALIAGLRQDPDVLVIGEMRDANTIAAALTAAETGHLVISTLHTNGARGAIERILDVFKGQAENQIKVQLASTLIAVTSQQLILKADQSGLVPAFEVMINSPTIANCILKNEMDKLNGVIANSGGYYKMQTLNQDLERLLRMGAIKAEDALSSSPSSNDLNLILSGMRHGEGY